MKYFILSSFLLFLFSSTSLNAQTTNITGQVVDSLQQPLNGASILLLNQTDSVLAKFAISAKDGQFILKEVPEGAYWLRATYVGLQNYTKALSVNDASPIAMGSISLIPIPATLETVVVGAERVPIVINGDTIQYHADAFKTQPNAIVEDLLRKLPGVKVDRNGQIRAQGKEVNRVLVDGKEFFGDDPQIATQNLPADVIDKVQVFDSKSETAEFTGIDDGERNTTINLKLKEDKKQGYFGTLEAGYGTEDRFAGKGNINRFNNKYQLSALGRYNNINEQGFTLQDYFNLMGGMHNALAGNNAISPRDLGISMDGSNRMDGFTTNAAGGVNLNYELNQRMELSASYFYNHIDRNINKVLERENFQGEQSTFYTNEMEDRHTLNNNNRLNTLFQYEIDSMQDLQLRANFGFNDIGLITTNQRAIVDDNQDLESTLDRNYAYDNRQFNVETRAIYRRKLSKTGRSLVADFRYSLRNEEGESLLNSINTSNTNPPLDSLLQEQETGNGQTNYAARLTYTEPLKKGYFLEMAYRRQNYNENATRNFYDLVNGQAIANQSLSNRFISDYTYDRIGLTLQRNRKKSTLAFNLDVQEARLKGDLQTEQVPLKRQFTNLLPALRWRYEFTSSKSIGFRYLTNIQEPNIQQLQPIVDNSDPFNIYIGNPTLKPEYQHQIISQLMWYDAFSFTNFFASINLRYTDNKITDATNIDDQFRQTLSPVNVDNDLNLRSNLSFGTPIRALNVITNLEANFYYNRGFLQLNGLENRVNRMNNNWSASLENRKKKIIDIVVGAEIGFQSTSYDLKDELNQAFSTQSYFIDCSLELGKQWRINSVLDYTIFPQGPFAAREERPIWEASVSRFFGEKQRGQLRLSAFDLLDRNTGLNRNATFNYIENERITSLGRYFMLSVVYSIKGFGK